MYEFIIKFTYPCILHILNFVLIYIISTFFFNRKQFVKQRLMHWCFNFFFFTEDCRKKWSKKQYKPFIKENSCFKICCMCEQHVISNLKDSLKITVFNILYLHNQFDFLLKTSEKSSRVLNWPLSLKRSLTYKILLCVQFVKHIVLLLYLNRLLFQIIVEKS